jgi:hypothetical protein
MKFSILTSTVLSVTAVSASYVPFTQRDEGAVKRATAATIISGTWFNELGSVMNITAETDGSLSRRYCSAVGTAINFYNLVGRFDSAPQTGVGVSIGWVVSYQNSQLNAHSTASWSGQFFAGSQFINQTILTQWLLTSSTTQPNVWESTQVGHDEFTRYQQVSGPTNCPLP